MSFELDITKRLRDRRGNRFTLRSRFDTGGGRVVLFGPSGSGKSLTLQAIAGLMTPDAGYIRVNGRTLFDAEAGINLPPRRRKVGLIFQDYALFPHMTVRENVAFGLRRLLGRMSAEDKARVEELLGVFGLRGIADAMPGEISGGQQQRTAMARGLAARPDLLLLDEPFSALDKPLRVRMQRELASTLRDFDLPLVLVTHDAEEMEYFADTVVVYDHGEITAIEGADGGGIDASRIHAAIERAYAD
jgi:molybdate transport system ATP-binding protein